MSVLNAFRMSERPVDRFGLSRNRSKKPNIMTDTIPAHAIKNTIPEGSSLLLSFCIDNENVDAKDTIPAENTAEP